MAQMVLIYELHRTRCYFGVLGVPWGMVCIPMVLVVYWGHMGVYSGYNRYSEILGGYSGDTQGIMMGY